MDDDCANSDCDDPKRQDELIHFAGSGCWPKIRLHVMFCSRQLQDDGHISNSVHDALIDVCYTVPFRKFSHASQPEKSPRLKSLELRRKSIGLPGQQIFIIRELTVEMVQ